MDKPRPEPPYFRLVEASALGREEHARGGAWVRGFDGVDRIPQGLAHHHHARTPAERAVVGFLVLVVGVVADVGGVPLDESGFARARGDADAQRGGRVRREHLGEGGEDVEAEGHAGLLARRRERLLRPKNNGAAGEGRPA